MAANIKYAVYKIFNGTDFDTIYFKAPALAITESDDKQFISKANKDLLTEYLVNFNTADKLVKLGNDGKISSDLINANFTNYLDKSNTADIQVVMSEVELNNADGLYSPQGIRLNANSALPANTNWINAVTGGIRLSIGQDASNQEITFTKDANLVFKKATEIKNVKEGADDSAVPKSYVDRVVESGAKPIPAVKAATTIPFLEIPSGVTTTIDGVSVIAGDGVLIKDQANQDENGIYVVSTGNWTKVEYDSNLKGALVFVEKGFVNNDSKWFHEGGGEWIKFSQTDQLQFGGGLSRSSDNVIIELEGITNDHIASNAKIDISKLGYHAGNITGSNWDDYYDEPDVITDETPIGSRLTDLAMTIYRIRGDVDPNNKTNYGEWNSNSLTIKKVNDVASAKQNPVRYGTASPTTSLYNEGDVYLLIDPAT